MVRGLLRWAVFALSAAGVLAAGGLPASPSREPEWVQKAEALARLAVSQGKTAGLSLFVRKRGRTWISGGYGEADLENHVAASPDTVYSIASITKQFTAAAIVQLVEAGKLGLDVQIEKYLPEYPPPGNRVTVRQLLNHTSGIRSMTSLGARYWSQIAKDVTPQETILLFENEPLDFEPGRRYAYNNSGYVLLGALIERVTG